MSKEEEAKAVRGEAPLAGANGSDPVSTPGDSDGLLEALPSAEELAALREKAALADGLRDTYVRTMAEWENFRKRSAREKQEAVQFANQGLLERLVPALDNLDMALAAVNAAQAGSVDALKTGVEMVLGQLRGILRDTGLEEINALGQPFDPTWHEAVSQQETDLVPEGQVVQQLRKGYRLHQRLIRPATVIIARQPQA